MAESIITNNLAEIHARIEAACARAGRDPSEVGLICVSKTKPAEAVLEAYTAGEKLFGENKVQEIREKAPVLPEDIQWHMIGHLQTNKVKQVIGHAAMIHGIDSVRLAETVSKEVVKAGIVMPVLIEVNMAAEESKYGIGGRDGFRRRDPPSAGHKDRRADDDRAVHGNPRRKQGLFSRTAKIIG